MAINTIETGKTNELLIGANKKIIQSVLTEGLKPSKDLAKNVGYFGSADKKPNDDVWGIIIPDRDHPSMDIDNYSFRDDIYSGLYIGSQAVFPVLAERPWNGVINHDRFYDDPKNVQLIGERYRNSFLVVCQIGPDDNSRDRPAMSPERFYKVYFPKRVLEEYRGLLEHIPCPFEVKGVDYVTGRCFDSRLHANTSVPDYEAGLIKLTEEVPGRKWAHAVRLYIEDDLKHL